MASAATIEEISVSWQDETGRETVKELDRVILSRGAWTTILFKYQDWDAKKGNLRASQVFDSAL